jgi:hypothetical protein
MTGAIPKAVGVPVFERRKEHRRPVFWDGKIGFNERQFRVRCLIQNISGSGAKLAFRSSTDLPALPTEFDISIPHHQAVYRMQIKWRHRYAIGAEIKHVRAGFFS